MSTADVSVVLVALDRWEPLWDRAIERVSDDQKRWLGIVEYSRELAWMTRKIIEVSLSKEGESSNYLQRTAVYDTASIHEFIQQFRFEN